MSATKHGCISIQPMRSNNITTNEMHIESMHSKIKRKQIHINHKIQSLQYKTQINMHQSFVVVANVVITCDFLLLFLRNEIII